MENEDNRIPKSKSLPVQSMDSGKQHNAVPRRTTAMLGQSRSGLSSWALSSGNALPVSVTRNPHLIRRPVVHSLDEVSYFEDAQPQLAKDDDDTCLLDIKSAISSHTPDGTSLLAATPTTEANDEGDAAPNTFTAKRKGAALSEKDKKNRNREYARRYRMKSHKAKSRQEQYIAELESQCNTLHTQVEAGNSRILELEEQVASMNEMATKYVMLEEHVKNLEEANHRLLMAQETKQAAPATTSPALDALPTSTVELGTSLHPFDYVTPDEPATTEGFGFFKRK